MLASPSSGTTDIKEVRKGTVGVASETGETSNLGSGSEIKISYDSSKASDAKVEVGSGVTVTTIDAIGGENNIKCGCTTMNVKGGTTTISGTGTITNLNIDGGEARPASSGTITTCTIDSGTADFTISAESRTVTTLILNGGILKYDRDVMTMTNKIEPASGKGRIQYSSNQI